jgi:two-component system NarL family sensor kinase
MPGRQPSSVHRGGPPSDTRGIPSLATIQTMLSALLEPAAFVSPAGEVLVANGAWKKVGQALNPHYLVDHRLPASLDEAKEILVQGRGSRIHHFKIETTPMILEGESYTFVRANEVGKLDSLKHEQVMLEDYLMRTEAHERRSIARDLHDTTAQLLVGLQFSMMRLKGGVSPHDAVPLLAECALTLDELQKTVREFRFAFTPDDWANEGIGSALERMTASFADATGLAIETHISIERDPSVGVAATLYRIAQEALSNVHRHAQATKVRLTLRADAESAHLIVSDNGVALRRRRSRPPPTPGVGLAGMQERVKELNGNISIRHAPDGTTIEVILPA